MATRYTDEFRRDAVRIAVTSGLTRPQVSSDLGVGLSTLNKWVQKHQHGGCRNATAIDLIPNCFCTPWNLQPPAVGHVVGRRGLKRRRRCTEAPL